MGDEKWRKKSLQMLKTYYLGFSGTQWHEFKKSTDKSLLKVKIAFAMFGPPTEDADKIEKIEDAYTREQRKKAEEIMNIILKVYDDCPASKLHVGFIIISCKQEKNEFSLPVFSVYVGKDNRGRDKRKFVDTQGRTYKDWDDWKKNNRLPKLQYAYPKFGYFTCSKSGSYEFDPEQDPIIEFGRSPQSSVKSSILSFTDTTSSYASIASGIVGITALCTPLAPILVTGAAVAGATSAVYGVGRSVSTLIDKGVHGQSLTDWESVTTWCSIVVTPFHFVSSAVNGSLALGAQQGRIFSNSMRMFATIVNITTLTLDSVLYGFGFANLIEKAESKELTALDVLQFSMSTFFFHNTLFQPKFASSVIRRAQQMHFDKMSSSISDGSARQAFDKFLKQNKSGGTITERSKIVRTINRMDDPSKFFKSAGPKAVIKIDGNEADDNGLGMNSKDPKPVLISDEHGYEQRVKPNNFEAIFTARDVRRFKFNKDYNNLKRCYGKNPEEVELNGEKIFQNLDDSQKRTINRTVRGTARNNHDIILTAHSIAEAMGCTTSDELMNIIEIVAKKVEGKSATELSQSLSRLQTTNRSQFISGIQADTAKAEACARKGGLNFGSPLKAVYHFRKHGEDFPKDINECGNTLEVYVGPVRDRLFTGDNLRKTLSLQNGIVKHIYCNENDEFGVVTSTRDGAIISTIFRKPGSSKDYARQIEKYFEKHQHQPPPEPVNDTAARLARHLGFPALHVHISVNGKRKPIESCLNLDASVHEHIAQYLNLLAADLAA